MRSPAMIAALATILALNVASASAAEKQTLFDRLLSADYQIQEAALAELAGAQPADKKALIEKLIPELQSKQSGRPRSAAKALGKLGPAARAALPALVQAMRGPHLDALDSLANSAAAQAIGEIGPDEAAVGALISAASEGGGDLFTQKEAVRALGKVGLRDPRAVAALIGAFKGPANLEAAAALIALGAPAVGPLRDGLKDKEPEIRRWCAITLGGKLGPAALQAAPDLVDALKDSSPEVRRAAAGSLGGMGKVEGVIVALAAAMKDEASETAQAASDSLSRIEAPAVDALIAALSQPGAQQRRLAAEALGKMGPPAKALKALERCLKDDDGGVRLAAAAALKASSDSQARQALKAYEKTEQDKLQKKIDELAKADLSSLVVALRRTACFGTCPVYEVTLYGDGRVDFEGADYVKVRGAGSATIRTEDLRQLLVEIEKSGFFSLKDSYENYMVTDNPTAITTISFQGRKKTIVHYHGDKTAPEALSRLEDAIDETAGTKRWIE